MRFGSVLDLPTRELREQAERKLRALDAPQPQPTHVCADRRETRPARLSKPKVRLNRRPVIPKMSVPEERLAFHLRAEGLAGFEREHRFSKKRFWRFDFAYLSAKLAIEVDGGAGTGGRHTRAQGFANDCEKLNEAAILGWRVLRFTPRQVNCGYAARTVRRALEEFRT